MKKLKLIFLVVILIISGKLMAQNVVSQLPEKPKKGDNVSITYNAANEKATLKDSKEILLIVRCYDLANQTTVKEIPMKNSGSVWTGSYQAGTEAVISYYFTSDANKDNNNNENWFSMMYNSKNQPVQDANYIMSNLSKEKSAEYLNSEIALYPGNVNGQTRKWSKLMREKPGDESIEVIKKELNKVYSLNKADEKAVYRLLPWYDKTKQTAKGQEINSSITCITLSL